VEEMVAAMFWPFGKSRPSFKVEMVHLPVYGPADGIPFPHFGIKLSEDETLEEFATAMEQEAREIIGDISDKEFLMRRSIAGTMPQLNRVFEELGIHHEEHKVPAKVLKSIEDKARKAAAKNNTTAVESKKRIGTSMAKVVSKKQKIGAFSAGASTDAAEEVTESVHGGSASTAIGMEGDHSIASANLGGDDFVQATLGGMATSTVAERSVVAPMPGVLGDDSSSSKG
jgi:hypothetical protein